MIKENHTLACILKQQKKKRWLWPTPAFFWKLYRSGAIDVQGEPRLFQPKHLIIKELSKHSVNFTVAMAAINMAPERTVALKESVF